MDRPGVGADFDDVAGDDGALCEEFLKELELAVWKFGGLFGHRVELRWR